VIAYQGGNTGANSRLVMFDGAGKEIKTIGTPGDFSSNRISPDGRRLAVAMLDSSVRNYKVWIFDLFRDKQSRLTFGPGRTAFPIWAPDGSTVVLASNRTDLPIGGAALRHHGRRTVILIPQSANILPRGPPTAASSPTTRRLQERI
jgi:Tol biopolymer transport system component